MSHASADEAQIRGQIARFAAAFQAKDVEGITALFTSDIISFDIVPPLQCIGLAAFREHWERTFASFTGPIRYEIHELSVVVRDDLAVTHSVNRRSGVARGHAEEREQWLRWTACFRKSDGVWLIKHEHVSVPMDPVTGEALTNLPP